ncbi:MAG: hypothetical protein P8Z30_08730 [Acidobacteriota bacterium]
MRRRHVTIKLSDQSLLNAEVRGEETLGLWLNISEDASLPGFPTGVQDPIVFVPFTQMIWLVTSSARQTEL